MPHARSLTKFVNFYENSENVLNVCKTLAKNIGEVCERRFYINSNNFRNQHLKMYCEKTNSIHDSKVEIPENERYELERFSTTLAISYPEKHPKNEKPFKRNVFAHCAENKVFIFNCEDKYKHIPY